MSDEARPRRRWGRWLGGLATLGVLVALLAYAARGRAAVSDLSAVIAELDATDPGWRIEDIFRSRAGLETQPDGAPWLMAVAAALPSGYPDSKARAALKTVPPNALLDGRQRAVLDGLLAGAPRQAARDLLRHPPARFEVRVHDFVARTRNPSQALAVARLLSYDAFDRAQAGQVDDALDSARACVHISAGLDADPTILGQLYRLGMVFEAREATQRALALGEPTDAALAELERAFAATGDGWTGAVRAERALLHSVFVEVGTGRMDAVEITKWLEVPKVSLYALGGPLVRQEMIRREHAPALRLMTRMVEATRLPPAEQFAAEAAVDAERRVAPGLVTPVLFTMFTKHSATVRTQRCALAAMRGLIAVERYRLRHGRWPEKVPEGCPSDPIDGAPLRYQRMADGVVVYSIGNDRKDDGGDVGEGKPDVGYRLWDVEKRRVRP